MPKELIDKYDVVFNHTTLEHIFEVRRAFENLCSMSRDIVIVIVPWMQEMHFGDGYADYWRISPYAIKKMFEQSNMELVYLDASVGGNESIYVFTVGSKHPANWKEKLCVDQKFFKELGNNVL